MNEQTDPPPSASDPGPEPSAPRTSTRTGTGTGTAEAPRTEGPRVSAEQMRDVNRLRRSSSDRYIAGVAGGLGRHFDVDPTVIRVLLVVLTLFGGAGVLIYGALWLFVPEDRAQRAPIDVGGEVLKVILIVTAVIAVSIVFGTPFFGDGWGFGFPFPLLLIALVAVAVYATRNRRTENRPPPPWGSYAPPPGTSPDDPYSTTATASATGPSWAAAPEGNTMTVTDQPPVTGGTPGQQPPAWLPPQPPPYLPPPRPRRTGLLLFWPTLALIAIALGTVGILDVSYSVAPTAYAALAVAVIGVMLTVGAFVGRPGGLIALGFAAILALLITLAAGVTDGGASSNEDVAFYPTTATDVPSRFDLSTGSITVDLTGVQDQAALDGRVVDLHVGAGEITVMVPRDLEVEVEATVHYAGEIQVGEVQRGGFRQSFDTVLSGATDNSPTLVLDLDANVGQITVREGS